MRDFIWTVTQLKYLIWLKDFFLLSSVVLWIVKLNVHYVSWQSLIPACLNHQVLFYTVIIYPQKYYDNLNYNVLYLFCIHLKTGYMTDAGVHWVHNCKVRNSDCFQKTKKSLLETQRSRLQKSSIPRFTTPL